MLASCSSFASFAFVSINSLPDEAGKHPLSCECNNVEPRDGLLEGRWLEENLPSLAYCGRVKHKKLESLREHEGGLFGSSSSSGTGTFVHLYHSSKSRCSLPLSCSWLPAAWPLPCLLLPHPPHPHMLLVLRLRLSSHRTRPSNLLLPQSSHCLP